MGQAQRLDLGELKTIPMPRQALLKRLDPTGELLVPTISTQPEPLVRQYERLVIQDRVDDGTHLKDVLKIYNYFHQLNRAPEWGEIALCCPCRVCFGYCICKEVTFLKGSAQPSLPTCGREPNPAEEHSIPSPALPSTSLFESDDDDFQDEVCMTA
jgi:hypothetical protein